MIESRRNNEAPFSHPNMSSMRQEIMALIRQRNQLCEALELFCQAIISSEGRNPKKVQHLTRKARSIIDITLTEIHESDKRLKDYLNG